MDIFFFIILIFIGLILGSFCTVCVYRLPQNLSIIKPRSFCINCKKTIQWFHNIPLFSFIFLKGKCGYCQKKKNFKKKKPFVSGFFPKNQLFLAIAQNLKKEI